MEVHLESNKSIKKKVWELIRDSVGDQISFGDAKISDKHSNFLLILEMRLLKICVI